MRGINAYHNSRELGFRTPFGAVKCGDDITLRLHVWGAAAAEAQVVLRTWNGYEDFYGGESRWENGTRVFEFSIKAPDKPCMLWYNFRVSDGNELYYVGAKDRILRSGEGPVWSLAAWRRQRPKALTCSRSSFMSQTGSTSIWS
ncbi:MAG: hypothetical protein II155_07625 [Clostridia bacterium]|nr:hypothetical protein [Clostridia bacterium]